MFKTIILQHYDNLSEEQRKFQLKDNLSFIDFLGLHLTEKVPDENTI
jgi:transposase